MLDYTESFTTLTKSCNEKIAVLLSHWHWQTSRTDDHVLNSPAGWTRWYFHVSDLPVRPAAQSTVAASALADKCNPLLSVRGFYVYTERTHLTPSAGAVLRWCRGNWPKPRSCPQIFWSQTYSSYATYAVL